MKVKYGQDFCVKRGGFHPLGKPRGFRRRIITNVELGAQFLFYEMIKRVEQDIGRELTRSGADRDTGIVIVVSIVDKSQKIEDLMIGDSAREIP